MKGSATKREEAEKQGRRAEYIAAGWLRLHGWRILAQRVRTQRGEIDLVAKRRSIVAFVEVKARSKVKDLETAIDHHRLKRVAAAAEILYAKYCSNGEDARIDVILVAPRRLPTHLPNVWHGF
ncbi:MAG: YraN family protein [Parasphingorhabdus sp.]|uniref:YraN family protein n=1 Tax=Parasphingorhabdus sp. TaxID=2709688 RepID=UPI003297B52B